MPMANIDFCPMLLNRMLDHSDKALKMLEIALFSQEEMEVPNVFASFVMACLPWVQKFRITPPSFLTNRAKMNKDGLGGRKTLLFVLGCFEISDTNLYRHAVWLFLPGTRKA